MHLLVELQKVPALQPVPEPQLEWLIDRGECLDIAQCDFLFEKGTPVDRLIILLSGEFVIKVPRNNQFQTIGKLSAPAITGLLPYSRADTANGFAEALTDARVLVLAELHFKEMITECHELTTVLVHAMSSRIRQFTKLSQQNDKMLSLGKLSAGLAHELNNPSAAVVRSAKELAKHLSYAPDRFKQVLKIDMTDEQVDAVNELLFNKVKGGIKELPLMEKNSREDEMLDWMEDNGVEEGEAMVDDFIDYDISIDDLELIASQVPTAHQNAVFGWVNQVLVTERLVHEIGDASQRIGDLVFSVKSYTHMDQAQDKSKTDIHTGINNTLTMLDHKLKEHKIEVIRAYGESVPEPEILPGAINQVWTNLFDNAIDAMEDGETRTLTIKTSADRDYVQVEVVDTGTGISEEVMDNIFDPFFTTKAIGKGTGLGLENVQQIIKEQHSGLIDVRSNGGGTRFIICIPIVAA